MSELSPLPVLQQIRRMLWTDIGSCFGMVFMKSLPGGSSHPNFVHIVLAFDSRGLPVGVVGLLRLWLLWNLCSRRSPALMRRRVNSVFITEHPFDSTLTV